MAKRGVSIFEIVALISLIVAAFVGDMIGAKHSEAMGVFCMFVFPFGLIFIVEGLAWLERELLLGQKPLPMCRCGSSSIDKMPVEAGEGAQWCKCRCGLKFDLSHRGKIMILDQDGEAEYAFWKPFKGWQVNQKDLCRR